MKKLSFFDKLVYWANILFAFILLLSFLGYYVSVSSIPFFSVLSLLVPILIIAHLCFVLYWGLRRKRYFFWSLLLLVISYLVYGSLFILNSNEVDSDEDGIKVLSYNVHKFNRFKWIDQPGVGDSIISFIKEESPDVLCLQEHSRIWHRKLTMYPYRYETPVKIDQTIQVIFSKYPMVNKGSLNFPDTPNNCIYADIAYKNDTIRVYNIHLQSLRIKPTVDGVTKESSEKLYNRLTSSFIKQEEQAKIFVEHAKTSDYKKIVCGDFNNTQFSNVYRRMKGDMTDSFLEKGNGFGRSFNFINYPLRIDYILADDDFTILSHTNFNTVLSDHFPVMATLKLPSH